MSFFNRPFGAQGASPSEPEPTQRLSQEWEALEARLAGVTPEEGHRQVGDFLRRWGVTVAQVEAARQGPLASLLESARASLLGQLQLSGQKQQAAQWRQAEARQQQALDEARQQAKLESGRAEVRRLQAETERIQAETYRATQASIDRNHQLAKAALFPEQHCPHCARSYYDLTGGCWHCQCQHRPGYF